MAAGKILSQLLKLRAKKKIVDNFLSSGAGKKTKGELATRVKKGKESVRLDKSIKRLEKQAAEAKTTSKDPQRLATEEKNRKRKISDSSVTMNYPGQTGMGGGSKTKRYRIKDKAFNKLSDQQKQMLIDRLHIIDSSEKFGNLENKIKSTLRLFIQKSNFL